MTSSIGDPLGPRRLWSPALSAAYNIVTTTGFAACATWGPEQTLMYNAAYIPVLGQKHPAALGQPIDQVWREVWDDLQPLVAKALAGESVYLEDLPLTITRSGAPEDTHWTFSYSPLRDGDEVMGMLDIVIETTCRVRAEQHRQLLINECVHRVKNTLALVQAVARSSLKDADPTLVAGFEARLHALARAQDALDERAWTSGDLEAVVRLALGNLSDCPFGISGPPVALSPTVSQTVALVIHELATNAFKYGALSVPGGRVGVHWTIDGAQLALVWMEQGGPPVTAPAVEGFGAKLVRRGLTGVGGARLSYEVDGFSAAFFEPLARLQAQ